MPLLNTARKMAIARALSSSLLAVGVKPRQRASRRGVVFELDLREGIDLSLFLFGAFQRHVVSLVERVVPADGTVIDVGANIGAVALPVAAHVTRGHVYAIEPTEYAFGKLAANVALNPGLAPRVTLVKSFVADTPRPASDLVAYGSWPVAAGGPAPRHPVHKGVPMEATCGQTTLDEFASARNLETLSLVKIDTDGHEFTVLRGATECLRSLRPFVIFEACEYLMKEPRPVFDDFARLFGAHEYTICDSATLAPIDSNGFYRECPRGGGLDLAAVPSERLAALRK